MTETKNGEEKGKAVALGATALKPETKEGFAGFLEFLFNKKKGTVLGRTGKSWALITIFYIIYYSCLAAFWAAMMAVFLTTIEDDRPKLMGADSRIGDKPGIGFRPSQSPDSVGSTIIYLNNKWSLDDNVDASEKDEFNMGYAFRLKEFFKAYDEKKSDKAMNCPEEKPNQASQGKFCQFDLASLGDCQNYPYGYAAVSGTVSPCVFLKLNRIFNLTPQPYTADDLDSDELKEDELKEEHIRTIISEQDTPKPFVDCQGEYPADKEALDGKMDYFPKDQSISMKYFPMKTKEQNQNALVALRVRDLPVGRMVQVICKVYYKGVKHEKKTKSGLVQFQLFVTPKAE